MKLVLEIKEFTGGGVAMKVLEQEGLPREIKTLLLQFSYVFPPIIDNQLTEATND